MGKHFILLGAPGSGKGTQAKLMVSEFGFKHLSTGDLLRSEVAKQTDLGIVAKGIMDSGSLVPDELMLKLIKNHCHLEKDNYVLDGFPRNLKQAMALDDLVLKNQDTHAVYLEIEFKLLKERLINRRACPKCGTIFNLITNKPKDDSVCDKCGNKGLIQREDDKEEPVRNRLQVFENSISPILKFYTDMGNLIRVDGSKLVNEVFLEIKKAIKF